MMKKQIIGLLLVTMLCLTGCSEKLINIDTLSLSKDGTASYTIISDFSASYYDLEELKSMAAKEVSEYGEGVQIVEAVVEEGVLRFVYAFDSLSEYEGFMNTSCYQGTVLQALKAGYKPDTILQSAKGNGTVTMKDLNNDKHHLFVWNENVAVRCTGTVLYYSDNLTVSDKTDVIPVTESTGPYYVIYK